jgi:hypothetical protein
MSIFWCPIAFASATDLTPEIVELAAARRPTADGDCGQRRVERGGEWKPRSTRVFRCWSPIITCPAVLPRAARHRQSESRRLAQFASPSLAGVGVAFYVVAALARSLGAQEFRPTDLLDLVALGRSRTWCRSIATIACWSPRACGASGPAAACREFELCSSPAAGQSTNHRGGSGICGGAAPECRRTAHRHERRDRLPARGRSAPRRRAWRAARGLNEERREIEQRMQLEALDIAGGPALQRGSGVASACACSMRSWHQGVVGLVAGTHQRSAASSRGRLRSPRGRRACAAPRARFPASIFAMRSTASPRASGSDREIRRPRHGRRYDPARGEPGEFRAAFAGEIAARADRESLTGVIHSDGVNSPRSFRSTRPGCCAPPALGAGFSRSRCSTAISNPRFRIVGGKHLKLQLRAADRSGSHRRNSCSVT